MAEEMVRNKKLLVVSLILGVVAVAMFYLYDAVQRQRAEGDAVEFLFWTRPLSAGDEVASNDLKVVEVSRRHQAAYEGVLQNTDTDLALAIGSRVNTGVLGGQPVRLTEVMARNEDRPSDNVSAGNRAYPIQVDPLATVGGMLRVNDRVDLIGLVSVKGRPPKAYTLIENLKVLGIGGRSESGDVMVEDASRRNRGLMVYRSITVEVSPKIARSLHELLPRVQGKLSVLVRRPDDTKVEFPGINPVLEQVLNEPLPGASPAAPGA